MKYFIFATFLAGWFNLALAQEKIDINTAPLEDLIKIAYIGEVRARELISLRPFSSLDDLTRIRGIGEKSVEAIKKQGLAWVDLAIEITEKTAKDGLPRTSQIGFNASTFEVNKKGEMFPVFTAVFTSLSGGAIILLLKKYVRAQSR